MMVLSSVATTRILMARKATPEGFERFRCELLQETDKAVVVEIQSDDNSIDGRQIWFPDSQIHDDSEVYIGSGIGEVGDIIVSTWVAEARGLA